MHAGEYWYKPGSKKRNRAEWKSLKEDAELSQAESGEPSTCIGWGMGASHAAPTRIGGVL
jgi:hypothetical protein